tara:strand:- start:1506 stop:2237 length:732 start_codon:yes stop_codon:yes gene_type:complete
MKPQTPLVIPTRQTFDRMQAAAAEASRSADTRMLGTTEGGELPAGWLFAKNGTGADVDRFAPMGVSGINISPTDNSHEFQNNASITLRTPTDADAGAFVIAQEPIENGRIGRVMATGVSPVKLYIERATDVFADINAFVSDDGMLLTGQGHARILYKEAGTGTGKWGLVQFPGTGGATLWRFALTASLSSGSAGATIKNLDGDTVTGSFTVRDPEGIFSTLTSGDTGLCLLSGDRYYVIQAGC